MPNRCSNKSCELPLYANDKYCILHSAHLEKDILGFNKQLLSSLSEHVNFPNEIVFEGIIFPIGFDLNLFLMSSFKGTSNFFKLRISYCKFNNDINLIKKEFGEIIFEFNTVGSITLSETKIGKLLIHDNKVVSINIDQSDIIQLTLLTYSAHGTPIEKIGNLFIILSSVEYTQISNLLFETVHIAITNFKGTLSANNIKSKNFMIRDSVFYSSVNLLEIKSDINFILERCIIQKPYLFSISHSDLSNSGFQATDISSINFIANSWRKEKQKKIEILDHRLAKSGTAYGNKELPHYMVLPEECAETYRQLKKNFESKGNFIDAGDFHYGEMEIRRLSGGALEKYFSLYAFYKLLSGYGEKPLRSITVFLIMLLSLALFQLSTGFIFNDSLIDYRISEIDLNQCTFYSLFQDFLISIKLTFANLTLRNISNLTMAENTFNILLWIFESIFGPIQLALIILSIKRKVRR
jgi:hypothetical protein